MWECFRRVLLSLSAYEFQRGYWFGGVLVLASLFFSRPEAAASSVFLADLLAPERVVLLAMVALVLPLAFTLLSEVAFWSIRKRSQRTYDPIGRFVRTSTERTESTQKRQDGGMTREVREVSTKEQYLVPVEAKGGGVKQIVACYWSKSFRSHFLRVLAPQCDDWAREGGRQRQPTQEEHARRRSGNRSGCSRH